MNSASTGTTEHLLPAAFARGFMDAFTEAHGLSWRNASINVGVETAATEAETPAAKELLYTVAEGFYYPPEPPSQSRGCINNLLILMMLSPRLDPVQRTSIPIKPKFDLPYSTLHLVYAGMLLNLGNDYRPIMANTYHIGRQWWQGRTDVVQDYRYPLVRLLDANELKAQYHPANSWTNLGLILQTIMARLSERGGIETRFEITPETMTMHFPVCPFCIDQARDCRLFHGVVDDILRWLYAGKTIYQVSYSDVFSHRVQIDSEFQD